MTQHLSERDVRGIAEYTRIGLTDAEVAQMTVDLNAIIDSLKPITEYLPFLDVKLSLHIH